MDIDLTLCDTTGNDYHHSTPKPYVIALINRLYEQGNKIRVYTGRGSKSGMDWKSLTELQLKEWGVKYNELLMGKPDTDYFIDDKNLPLAALQGQDPTLVEAFVKAFLDNKKVLAAGNGGLASDAEHFVGELVGKYAFDVFMPAIALTSNSAVVTAIANDMGYEKVFAHQVQVLGERGDIFVGMTTTQSKNVVYACEAAHDKGLLTVMVCGQKSELYADYVVRMDGNDVAEIQNSAIQFLHSLAYAVKKEIWDNKRG